MADIASLSLEVRSDGVKQANLELRAMPQAASAAEKAAQKWGMTTTAAGKSSEEFSRRVRRNIETLEFQRQQLGRSASEQAKYAALRRAGVAAESAAGQAIAANVAALQAQKAALTQNSAAVTALGAAWTRVRGLAAGAAAFFGGREILKAADSYTTLTNSLKVAGLEGGDLAAVQDRLFAAANKNGVEIGALSTLYSRASIAGKELGSTQEDLLRFVDGVTAAMRVQGGSSASASGALLQLSQALGSGIVRAEEFNSILEGAFPIAQAAARGIDGMGGSVAKLRAAIVAGTVTSKMFFDGLLRGFTATEAQAAGMSLTMGGALTVLRNSFTRLVGTLDNTFGASSSLAKGIASIGRGLDWLAANMGSLAQAATVAGIALAVAFAPATLNAMAYSFGLLGAAGVAAMRAITAAAMANPFVALATAITAVAAAVWFFRDEIQAAIGVDVIGIVKTAANFVINSFQAAYEDVKFVWSNFPDIIEAAVVGAANAVARGVGAMVQAAAKGIDWLIDKANKIPGVSIDKIGDLGSVLQAPNPAAERLGQAVGQRNARVNEIMSRDTLGAIGQVFSGSTPGTAPGIPGGAPAGALAGTKKGGSDPYAKAIETGREYILTKEAEIAAIGKTVVEAARLKHEQELLNKAMTEGKTVTDEQKAALQALAADMAAVDSRLATAEFMHEASKSAQEFIADQQLLAQTIGMTEEAAARLRYEQELLNKAANDNIQLTPEQAARLRELAGAMAGAEAQTKKAQEEFNFWKDTTKGFLTDMRNGLEQGKTIWQSFGDAAVTALNKIADRLLQMAVDELFAKAFGGAGGGGGSGGGGFLGSAIGWLGDIIGGLFANGAAFQHGNVIPFARGGVVSSPTFFPMANGMGLMGEAGPEAVMPLQRGRDGRLGVSASPAAGGRQQPVIVHVTGDTDLVRVTAEGAAVRVVRDASPKIIKTAVDKSRSEVIPEVNRFEAERGGDWRNA